MRVVDEQRRFYILGGEEIGLLERFLREYEFVALDFVFSSNFVHTNLFVKKPVDFGLVGFAIAFDKVDGVFFMYWNDKSAEFLKSILEGGSLIKVVFDMEVLRGLWACGLRVQNFVDMELLSKLLDFNRVERVRLDNEVLKCCDSARRLYDYFVDWHWNKMSERMWFLCRDLCVVEGILLEMGEKGIGVDIGGLKNLFMDSREGEIARRIYDHLIDNRVHGLWSLDTVSFRAVSRLPNLQGLPRDGRLRSVFCSSTGHSFIGMDVNQAELRMLAVLSGDEELCGIFEKGADLHTEVAGWLGITRECAKAVNFGIMYGITGEGLSKILGVDVENANAVIINWFNRFGGVRRFFADIVDGFGMVRNFFGVCKSVKNFSGEEGYDFRVNQIGVERRAINWVIQSSVALMMHLFLKDVVDLVVLSGLDCFPVMQMHDGIVFECANVDIDEFQRILDAVADMNFGSLRVPVVLKKRVGTNLGVLV
jgi:hypothetical protein